MKTFTDIIEQELDRYLECVIDPLITPPALSHILRYREVLNGMADTLYQETLIPEEDFRYLKKKLRELLKKISKAQNDQHARLRAVLDQWGQK